MPTYMNVCYGCGNLAEKTIRYRHPQSRRHETMCVFCAVRCEMLKDVKIDWDEVGRKVERAIVDLYHVAKDQPTRTIEYGEYGLNGVCVDDFDTPFSPKTVHDLLSGYTGEWTETGCGREWRRYWDAIDVVIYEIAMSVTDDRGTLFSNIEQTLRDMVHLDESIEDILVEDNSEENKS